MNQPAALSFDLWVRLAFTLALTMGLPLGAEGADLAAADAAFDAGSLDRALEMYAEVIEVDPENEHALVRYGMLVSWTGQFAAAVKILDRALTINPNNEPARRQRAWVLAWDLKLEPAAQTFRELLQSNPNDSDARLGLARSLAWSGRFRESASECQKVSDLEPQGLDGRTCYAYAKALQGRHTEARALYEQVLSVDPSNLDARLGLSRLDLWSGNSGEAFSRAQELQSEFPLDVDIEEILFQLRQLRVPQARATYDGSRDEVDNALDVLRVEMSVPLPASSDLTMGIARSNLSNPTRTGRVDSLYATGGIQPGAGQRIGFHFGIDRKQNSFAKANSDVVGGVDYVLGLDRRWKAFGSVDRHTLIYSPEILDNDIVNDRARGGVSRLIGERWNVNATAMAASVSDGNRFFSFSSSLHYRLPTWSKHMTVGYRVRVEDFAYHMGNGYFDPSNFVSHLGILDLRDKFWQRRAYYRFHLEVGMQSFDFGGFHYANDHVVQWDATLGIPLGHALYVESYGSWSNYIPKSPTGFRSRRFGLRFLLQLER